MSHKYRNKYVDLKVNGRLFPSWILANFKKYKLPEDYRLSRNQHLFIEKNDFIIR